MAESDTPPAGIEEDLPDGLVTNSSVIRLSRQLINMSNLHYEVNSHAVNGHDQQIKLLEQRVKHLENSTSGGEERMIEEFKGMIAGQNVQIKLLEQKVDRLEKTINQTATSNPPMHVPSGKFSHHRTKDRGFSISSGQAGSPTDLHLSKKAEKAVDPKKAHNINIIQDPDSKKDDESGKKEETPKGLDAGDNTTSATNK